MTSELERFTKLFDALVLASNKWIDATPPEKLDWQPLDNPQMKFGDRVSHITIRSLHVHTLTGEKMWASMLSNCREGEAFRPIPEKELTQRLMSSQDLIEDSMTVHRENMATFAGFSDAKGHVPGGGV
jgi:hypothetical protein